MESTISTIIFPVYEDDTDVGLIILPPVPNGKPFLYSTEATQLYNMVGKYSLFTPNTNYSTSFFMLYTRTSFFFFLIDCYLNPTIVHVSNIKFT